MEQPSENINEWGEEFLYNSIEIDFLFSDFSLPQPTNVAADPGPDALQQTTFRDGLPAITGFNFVPIPSNHFHCNSGSFSNPLSSDTQPSMSTQTQVARLPEDGQFRPDSLISYTPHVHSSNSLEPDFDSSGSLLLDPNGLQANGNNPLRPPKRSLKDSMEFSITDNTGARGKRTRRKFDQKARKHVALVRKIGSCIQCRIRKVQVSSWLSVSYDSKLTT
jgi:hypothetical protein